MTYKQFQKIIWDYYQKEGRKLPWRNTHDPYKILVSELMLQQTQVDRVIPKYKDFLKKFPNVKALAEAKVSDVLSLWSGLGYNRRALFLKRTAEEIVKQGGKFPKTAAELEKLPGVGPYTARAVSVFAFENSEVFIETNIRTVFIHFFFKNTKSVSDKDILILIEKTLPLLRSNTSYEGRAHTIRAWYYALMDYGVYLKKTKRNLNERSAHYAKQSKFKGSRREVRGAVLKLLMHEPRIKKEKLISHLLFETAVTESVLESLKKEGFINITKGIVQIA